MIAAIYSRKSVYTDKGESVENQISLCKTYAKNLGINDFLVYEDEGFSGKDTNRPQFKQMIKDSKKKKFDVLICYRLDRISRNVADFANTIEELQKNNINFISIKEQFDTTSPMGRAMMNIAAVFAQLERETIAERIKDNMMELAKTGRWLGGTSPLGYTSEPIKYKNTDGKIKKMFKLTLDNEEIKTVKLIYKLFLEKKGFHSVANYLCRECFKGKNGGNFSRETVRQILCNPVYCIADEKVFEWFKKNGATVCGTPKKNYGIMAYNKRSNGGKKDNTIDKWIISIGKHKGIISPDDWIKCQNIIAENNKNKSHRSGTGKKFLLSGLLVCNDCGSSMSSWSHFNKNRNVMERYYRCNLKQRAANRCSSKMLNADKAHEYIINALLNVDEKIFKKQAFNNYSHDSNMQVTQIKALKETIEKNNKTIKGLIRKIALLDDDIDLINMFKNEINSVKEENNQLNIKLKEIELKDLRYKNLESNISLVCKTLKQIKSNYKTLPVEKLRLYIKSIVNKIIWDSKTDCLKIDFFKIID